MSPNILEIVTRYKIMLIMFIFFTKITQIYIRRDWRYQRGNHNPYIEEEHNDQMKKYKRTNNDLQNIHIKLKIE